MTKLASSITAIPVSTYCAAGTLLLGGGAIAAMAGFDVVFNAITSGSAWLRVVVFALIVIVGLFCAKQANLRLVSHRLPYPIATPLAIGFLVAFVIALIDSVIFRAALPQSYVASFAEHGVGARLIYYMLRAFNEEILYRLFLMSALVCGLRLIWRNSSGGIPNKAYWIAIIAAQTIVIFLNVAPSYASPAFILYVILRFICPGVLWGYLYWRDGFVTAQIAHISTHIFLQPILGYTLG